MRISIRGTDKGNAILTAMALIMILSFIFITLVPRIGAIKQYAQKYKELVLKTIEEDNRRAAGLYDFH